MSPTALPLSHETWFVRDPDHYPLDWAALGRPAVVIGLVLVVALAVVWRVVARRLPSPELPLRPLARLVPWVPRLLGIHLGVSLLLLTFERSILDPGIAVDGGALGTVLLLPQALAAVLLVTGYGVRLAAWSVVAAGPVLLLLAGPQALFSCLVLLGIAVFLIVVPPQRRLGGRARLDAAHLRPAVLALRLGTAGSLLTLAVVEKLANPGMADAMLTQEPVLQVLSPFGVSPSAFAVIAGLVEVLFALLVLSGALPQVVALVAAVPFTASLLVFGSTELVGHLPVYGVFLTLLVLGSKRSTSLELSRLRHRRAGAPDPVGQRSAGVAGARTGPETTLAPHHGR